jgi:hypothetical protein
MSARLPVGRSYSTSSAQVRHRHSPVAIDDAAPPTDWKRPKRGKKSQSTRDIRWFPIQLVHAAQRWMDETRINLQNEISRGTLSKETVGRVLVICIIGYAVLRQVVRLLLYSAALDKMNEVKILISTQYIRDDIDDASSLHRSNSRPWMEALPFLPRSIRRRRGGIDYHALEADAFDAGRRIREHDMNLYHSEKLAILDGWDAQHVYHDAREKDLGQYIHYEEDDYPKANGCYRPKWSYAYYPTCNSFHEFHIGRTPSRDSLDVYTEYISHGFFRETFRLQQEADQEIVLKVLRLHNKKNVNSFVMEQVQLEALVMGESSGSGLTFEIYGHCGTSVFVERGYLIRDSVFIEQLVNQSDLDAEQVVDVKPRNSLSNEQRLRIALTMAESLAVLHGNKKGVIVNDDVQIEQWLLDRNGHLKLNDFNNAVIMKWSPTQNNYCMFRGSFNYIYRSPDENSYAWTDESSDTYALGLIYYTLMTGLVPFYQHKDWDAAVEALKAGDKPYIDPRYTNHSLIESGLVEIMQPCWAFDPNDRPRIFTVVKMLRDLVDRYEHVYPNSTIRKVDLATIGYI